MPRASRASRLHVHVSLVARVARGRDPRLSDTRQLLDSVHNAGELSLSLSLQLPHTSFFLQRPKSSPSYPSQALTLVRLLPSSCASQAAAPPKQLLLSCASSSNSLSCASQARAPHKHPQKLFSCASSQAPTKTTQVPPPKHTPKNSSLSSVLQPPLNPVPRPLFDALHPHPPIGRGHATPPPPRFGFRRR